MNQHRSRLVHFVIDVDDLNKGTAFRSAALDATEEPLNPDSGKVYRRLRLPDSEIRVLLQLTTDPKVTKERIHLDLETDNVEAEVRRLEALGATRWDHQQETRLWLLVMHNPWGNEFCVLQPNFPDLLAHATHGPRRRQSTPTNTNQTMTCPAAKSFHVGIFFGARRNDGSWAFLRTVPSRFASVSG